MRFPPVVALLPALGVTGCAPEAVPLGPYSEVASEWGADHWAPPPPEPDAVLSQTLINGGGAGLLDLDADGDLDRVLTSLWGETRALLWGGDGFFDAPGSGLEELTDVACVSAADLDHDGLRDLLLCVGGEVVIYRNLGARFERVGVLATVESPGRPEAVAIADVDGDGFVDAYVVTQGRHPQFEPDRFHPPDRLFYGRGGFDFDDASALLGSPEDHDGRPYAAAWFDPDGDGDLDVLVIMDKGGDWTPSRVFLNPGRGERASWTEASGRFGLDLEVDGMGVSIADIEGDGVLDVAVSDNRASLHLVELEGGTDTALARNLVTADPRRFETSWAPALADLDNDADHDIVVAFGRREYGIHQDAMEPGLWRFDERFEDARSLLDVAPTTDLEAWRGVLPGDIDGDGTLELVLTSHVGPTSIQRTSPTPSGWVSVSLAGPDTNPDGLGARVDVFLGDQVFTRHVSIGSEGLASALEPRVHLGLNDASVAEAVVVTWPDGTRSAVQEVAGAVTVAY